MKKNQVIVVLACLTALAILGIVVFVMGGRLIPVLGTFY